MFLPTLPKVTRCNFAQNAISGFGFATGIYVASFVFVPLLELVVERMEQRRTDNLIATLNELPRCVQESKRDDDVQKKSATFTVGDEHEDEEDNHDVYHSSHEEDDLE